MSEKVYRKGAIGALLDEYERAVEELKSIINQVSESDYEKIFDAETSNEDCRSIQTIMSHVVRACYGYANSIRKAFSIDFQPYRHKKLSKVEVIECLEVAMTYTETTLEGSWEMSEKEMMETLMRTHWGVIYDIEQLLEHAIVHILRHRRQIEKLLAKS
jgi:uncharacterized damage-inducible protein DinB